MAKNLRFIQCGDLHLGSPFHNLAAIDDRWQRIIGKAPVRAFQKIVQLAIDKQVHAVLITGDVYTSANHNLTAQLDYVRLLHKLAQHQIQVFAVLGNHDPSRPGRRRFPSRPTSISFRQRPSNGSPCSLTEKKQRPFTDRAMPKVNSGTTWPGSSTGRLAIDFPSECSTPRSAAESRRTLRVPSTT